MNPPPPTSTLFPYTTLFRSEMEAMFDSVAEDFRRGNPIGSWRRTYRTRESAIASLLAEAGERWPGVVIGSYPASSEDRKSTRLNSSHSQISYAVFCLKKKKK